jgi:hypothetical protein
VAARRTAAANLTPPRLIEELPDMAVASAGRIYARHGLSVRPAASNCGGGGKFRRGLRRGGDQVTTRIGPLDRIEIAVDAGRMRMPASRMGAGGPMRCLFHAKKASDPQIGSGGAMRACLRCVLELL